MVVYESDSEYEEIKEEIFLGIASFLAPCAH